MIRLLSGVLAADGAEQMAIDEALLDVATEPTLRLYRWQPATVSLGYFQDCARIRAALPASMPLVRRITGGGAIWHDHEITYALVGTLGQNGLPERTREIYPLLHGAVLAALRSRGAALRISDRQHGDRRYHSDPRCFASPSPHDLLAAAGAKVLGSAARTRGQRVLVHGSLKLKSNPWDGPTVAGCGLDPEAAAESLRTGLCNALGVTPAPGVLTAAERTRADELRAARYGGPDWVEHRRGPPA
ncbi:MAG: lipoate--protein ligase family protein [Planctomycetota bacterium]